MENAGNYFHSLSNLDKIDIDEGQVYDADNNSTSIINKAYSDASDAVLQSQITTLSDSIGLGGLTTDEVTQLKNIGTTTISATQWDQLGDLDQYVDTDSNVQFNQVKAVDSLASKRWYSSTTGNEPETYIETTVPVADTDIVLQTVAADDSNKFTLSRDGVIKLYDTAGTVRITLDPNSTNDVLVAGDMRVSSGGNFTVDGEFDMRTMNTTIGTNSDDIDTLEGKYAITNLNSAADVKSAYESNADTNAFTDAKSNQITTNTTNIGTLTTDVSQRAKSYINGTNLQAIGKTTAPANLVEGAVVSGDDAFPTFTSANSRNIVLQGANRAITMGNENVVAGALSASTTNSDIDDFNVIVAYDTNLNYSGTFNKNIIIGYSNSITGTNPTEQVVIGSDNIVSGTDKLTIIGDNHQTAGGSDLVIIGDTITSANAAGSDIVAMGSNLVVNGLNSITAVGSNITAGVAGQNQTKINILGTLSSVRSELAGIFGSNSTIGTGTDNSFIIGNDSSIPNSAVQTLLFGNSITAGLTGGFILDSAYDVATGTAGTAVFETVASGIIRLTSLASTRRKKKDEVALADSEFDSSDIYKLKEKAFTYKEKGNRSVGVIAEDCLETDSKLLRSLVVWGDCKKESDMTDEEWAKQPVNGEGYHVKSFNYQGLITPMISEMRKLKKENEDLKKVVDEMKVTLMALSKKLL